MTETTGSLALWTIEVLDFLYYSAEGFDDMEFLDRFMERAEELKILGRAKVVPDSEYEWYWLRNYLENGEVDSRRLLAEGDIENKQCRRGFAVAYHAGLAANVQNIQPPKKS